MAGEGRENAMKFCKDCKHSEWLGVPAVPTNCLGLAINPVTGDTVGWPQKTCVEVNVDGACANWKPGVGEGAP